MRSAGKKRGSHSSAHSAGVVRARWGRVLWAPLWAALQWEHWFCCGGISVGLARQVLRLFFLVRSNRGYPYVPREHRTSSRGSAYSPARPISNR